MIDFVMRWARWWDERWNFDLRYERVWEERIRNIDELEALEAHWMPPVPKACREYSDTKFAGFRARTETCPGCGHREILAWDQVLIHYDGWRLLRLFEARKGGGLREDSGARCAP